MRLFNGFHAKLDLLGDAGGAGGGSGGGADAGNSGGNNPNAANASAGNASNTSNGVDWAAIKASLPDDLKNDTSLSTIKDVQGLVKGYVHSQKMIGRSSIPIPDAKHATESDWLQVFRKLGAPEKLEDFNFKLPDGVKEDKMDPTFLKSVKEAALQAGVLPWQFEKIFGAYHNYTSSQMQQSEASYKEQVATDVNALKTEWGQAFDTQVKKANVALRELVGDQDRARLIEDGLGSHPVVLKILANASKYFKEDTFLGHGEGTLGGMTPQDALQRARDIQGDPKHPYRNASHPNHKAAKKEVADLYKLAFPE
jgi:hypothetical protein